MDKQLKVKSLNAVKWATIERISVQGLTLVIGVLLARLLSPEEFGLLSMVVVFTGVLQLFKDFGFGAAIIQKKEIKQMDLDTAFWTLLTLGILLGLAVLAIAPLVTIFYDEPLLYGIVQLMSINFFVFGFTYVQEAILKKALDFRKLFFTKLVGISVSGALALIMAFMGYGIWSLVWRTIALNILITVSLWVASDYRPKFNFSKKIFREFMSFGLPLMGTSLMSYGMRNADNLLIGKFLGQASLGLYGRAYQLMLLPVKQISSTISKVLFPSFSIIKDDKKRVADIFVKVSFIVGSITVPLMIAIHLTAYQIIFILLGEAWLGAVPLVEILSIVGISQSLNTLIGTIFNSQGSNMKMFKMNLVSGIIMVVATAIGLYMGSIVTVAWSILISSLILFFPQIYIAGSVIDLSLKAYMNKIIWVFLGGIIAFGFTSVCMEYLFVFIDVQIVNLILVFVASFLFYGSAVYLFQKNFVMSLFKSIRNR